ncbi:PadR family transcriptional regulator [Micromonospora sp. M12]
MLGLLVEQPAHAYDLTTRLRERYGYLSVTRSTVTSLLKALEKAGLVSSRLPERVGKRPPRTAYELTTAGLADFRRKVAAGVRDTRRRRWTSSWRSPTSEFFRSTRRHPSCSVEPTGSTRNWLASRSYPTTTSSKCTCSRWPTGAPSSPPKSPGSGPFCGGSGHTRSAGQPSRSTRTGAQRHEVRYLSRRAGRHGLLHPPDAAAIRHLVDDITGGRPFVIREYVHFFGDATPPDVVTSLGAEHELAHLTMPDEWYVEETANWTSWSATSPGRRPRRMADLPRHRHRPLRSPDAVPPGDAGAELPHPAHRRKRTRRTRCPGPRDSARTRRAGPTGSPARTDRVLRRRTTRMVGRRPRILVIPVRNSVPGFRGHVDYVGLGLYPDAFSPVAPRGPGRHRIPHQACPAPPAGHVVAARARRPGIPIHLVENGSPSGSPRTEQAQCDSLSDMLGVILSEQSGLHITHYELFSLRDADSSSTEPTGTLGIVTDTYRPKPAYAVYRDILQTSHRDGVQPPAAAATGRPVV